MVDDGRLHVAADRGQVDVDQRAVTLHDPPVEEHRVIRSRSLRVLGYTNNELTREQKADAMTAVAQHAPDGTLSVAHEVVPLEDAAAAWQRQAEGRTSGRLVRFRPDGP